MTTAIPAKMHVAQFSKQNGDLEYVERPVPVIKPNEVLVKVEACGVCHSDMFAKFGVVLPVYPRVPGHEVIGTVVQVGSEAKRYKVGDRVGRGWHGGHCFECDSCFRGDFQGCPKEQVSGITTDGGYAEYMSAPWESLCSVPAGFSAAEAAPLLCAGLTVFNGMRHENISPGSVVAVQGLGGLGHLAVQYGRAMGFRVVALSSGDSKRDLAKKLGANVYVDCSKENAVEELKKLGGAKLIVCTAPASNAMSSVVDGLARGGKMLIVGADGAPVSISPFSLISGNRSVNGHSTGTAMDEEDVLAFSAYANVKPMIEVYPLSKAQAAYDRMISNKARFRAVVVPDKLIQ